METLHDNSSSNKILKRDLPCLLSYPYDEINFIQIQKQVLFEKSECNYDIRKVRTNDLYYFHTEQKARPCVANHFLFEMWTAHEPLGDFDATSLYR